MELLSKPKELQLMREHMMLIQFGPETDETMLRCMEIEAELEQSFHTNVNFELKLIQGDRS